MIELLEKLCVNLKQAQKGIREKNADIRYPAFNKCYEIACKFRKILNVAHEFDAKLDALFEFTIQELLVANTCDNADKLDFLIKTWTDIKITYKG